MSIEAVGRTLPAPLGGNAKVILLGMANHAHADGTNAYPSMETLAGYAHCDRRTAQRNVRKLEGDGFIEREGVGPAGQTRYRVVFGRWEGGGKMPGPNAAGGIEGQGGAAPVPPEPSIEPSKGKGSAPARADAREALPDDFPDDLRPHARAAYRILRQVAADHGAKRVWPLALGRCIMSHPRKPLVATAHALHTWAVDPGRKIQDVVGTYRSFLARESDLETAERLADDGTPMGGRAGANGHGPNVVPFRESYRDKKARERDERNAQRLVELHALQAAEAAGNVNVVPGTEASP